MTSANNAAFIWSVADLLRGPYKPAEYGPVILPFTVLRRLDCVLEPTKDAVLAKASEFESSGIPLHVGLPSVSGHSFYNTSAYTLASLVGDPDGIRANLHDYVNGFSANVRDIFEQFEFDAKLAKLDEYALLYLVTKRFTEIDLHPDAVSNIQMGLMFEELIRKFAESSNETAGEHFTPREVIRLMVDLLFVADEHALGSGGVVRTIYDPTAGTGGMLSVAADRLRELNPKATLAEFGQEVNPASYAICKADMVIKGQDVDNIIRGDTLTADGHSTRTFDYGLSNPPFGVEWKKQQAAVTSEHRVQGHAGRFGPGLPRVSDGSLLFLMHLIAKMRPAAQGGARIGIVLNGSPLFTGGAGSGESEIRRWIIEKDLLDAIIGLPTDMFYNTGISTYLWILDNRKPAERKGKVQLIDGTAMFRKMKKSLGSKRKELGPTDIEHIVKLYGEFAGGDGPDQDAGASDADSEVAKVFNGRDFGYYTITVERPLRMSWQLARERVDAALAHKAFATWNQEGLERLRSALAGSEATPVWVTRKECEKAVSSLLIRAGHILQGPPLKAIIDNLGVRDPEAAPVRGPKGKVEPDPELRDTENVPLTDDITSYFDREVLPHVPDAWVDHDKTKIGYEIPFTRHFYRYVAPRPLAEIDAELNTLMAEIVGLLKVVES
ncbi:MAG: class I SAM-dependent DNA methyltransferase [Nakamurella sp.]